MPGAVFVITITKIFNYFDFNTTTIENLFLYYFSGMIISSVGSVFIEPFCKCCGIVKYADYKDYLQASSIDNKINILLESNNLYRTFLGEMVIFLLLIILNFIFVHRQYYEYVVPVIINILLIILFTFSYKKQTDYIRKRITIAVNKGN